MSVNGLGESVGLHEHVRLGRLGQGDRVKVLDCSVHTSTIDFLIMENEII